MHLPIIPENAPFSESQRLWLNGYLAGLFSGSSAPGTASAGAPAAAAGPVLGPLRFLFGTQTGGSETLARTFAKDAKKKGFQTSVSGMDSFAELDFSKETRLAVITSTYGEGDMPDNAQAFWDFLSSGGAPDLSHVEFSVLALGDTAYAKFCEAGKKFDARLAELGARRVHDRVDCDADFETAASSWFSGFLTKISGDSATARIGTASAEAGETEAAAAYSKSRPFPARLKVSRPLNGAGSSKETRHVELILDGSGLEYEAGDALGVLPKNCPAFVEEILHAAGLRGEETALLADGRPSTLHSALVENLDLKPFLSALPEKGLTPESLIAPLRKLQPRLYSISSSPKAHPGEVHLTVGIVRYELNGRPRKGVCSTFLAEFENRAGAEPLVPVFVHRSPHFKLPADNTRPVIMVGPGTGIAPFRSFLEERRATASSGRNWLFFGDQKSGSDFLYQEELSAMSDGGYLHRLDLAFSRDQEAKIYVQHRMLEQAEELWRWFGEGAHFYVCGDASRMAKDVDAALHQVAQTAGGRTAEQAAEWVATLKKEKRYLRDVY
ncbi:MAG: flavodoxin domain-containing protein [Verrucomicrobiota bacterium]